MSASALATLVILGGISLVSCDANVTVTTTSLKPEILELVDVLKQDLRKNNDDYAEHQPRRGAPRGAFLNLTMKPKPPPAPAGQQLPSNNQLPPEDTRRRLNPVHGHNPRHFMKNFLSKAGLRGNAQHKPDPKKLRALAQKLKFQRLMKNNYPKKYTKKDKTDRLKMFIQKNKGKLEQFVNKQKLQAIMKARTDTDTTELETSEKDELRFKLPEGDQLDMAPARGSRIHAMRLKGRLCYRNVMFPEGPKYDSKGQIYLKAHGEDRQRARDYEHTTRAMLVIPKCCNCCEKSVLGCE